MNPILLAREKKLGRIIRTRKVSGRTSIKHYPLQQKSVSQQLRRKNRMDEGCLAEEIEVLEAIYIHELEVEKDNNGGVEKIQLQLHPATGDDVDQQYVCMTLILDLPKTYPEEPPDITIKNPRGIGEEEVQSLTEAMHKLSEDRTGGPMLYELIELAKESLTQGNIPRCACMICLEQFVEGDCFTRTQCYHYFHESCLARYTRHSLSTKPEVEHGYARHTEKEEKHKLVCPVCREEIQDRSDDLPEVNEEDSVEFQPSEELRAMQKEMAEIFERQKAKGGIIDLEAERNKYLIKEDDVVHLHTVASDPDLQGKDEASSTRSRQGNLDRPGSGRDTRQKNSPRPSDKYDRGKDRPDSGYQRDRRKENSDYDRGKGGSDSRYQRDRRGENDGYGKGRFASGYQRDRRRDNNDRGKGRPDSGYQRDRRRETDEGRDKSDYVREKGRGDHFDNKPHSDDEAVRRNVNNRDSDRNNDRRRDRRLNEDWRGNRRNDKHKQEPEKSTEGSKDAEKDVKPKNDEPIKDETSSAQDQVGGKPSNEVGTSEGVTVKADQKEEKVINDDETLERRNNPKAEDISSEHYSGKSSSQGKTSHSSRNNDDRDKHRQDNWRDRREQGSRPNSSRQSERRYDRDDRNSRNYKGQAGDRGQGSGNDRTYRDEDSKYRGGERKFRDRDSNYRSDDRNHKGEKNYKGGESNYRDSESNHKDCDSKYKKGDRNYDRNDKGSDNKFQRNNRDRQNRRDRDFAERDGRQQCNEREKTQKRCDTELSDKVKDSVTRPTEQGPKSANRVNENECNKINGATLGDVKHETKDKETRDGSTSDRIGSGSDRVGSGRRGRGRGRGFRGRQSADDDRREEHTSKSVETDKVEKDFRSLRIGKTDYKKESSNKIESKRDTTSECNNFHEKANEKPSTGASHDNGGAAERKGEGKVKGPPGFKTKPPPGFHNDPMGVGQLPPGF